MQHKDIQIRFTVGGRHYEAVGFLEENETDVCGNEMIARTDTENTVVDEEDCARISEHQRDLPGSLQKYHLVTKRCSPEDSRIISFFFWDLVEWDENWGSLDLNVGEWTGDNLVLRRCI